MCLSLLPMSARAAEPEVMWMDDYAIYSWLNMSDWSSDFHDGLAAVRKNGKFGYIDTTGKLVIPCEYDYPGEFHEGYAIVGKGYTDEWNEWKSKYGLIDKTGKLVVPCEYRQFDDEWFVFCDFSDGLVRMAGKIEGSDDDDPVYKYGYVDGNGKVVIPFKYDDAGSFVDGLAPVMDDNGKVG